MAANLLHVMIEQQRKRKRLLLQSRRNTCPRVVERRKIAKIQTSQKRRNLLRPQMIDRNRDHHNPAFLQRRRQSGEGREFRHARPAPGRPKMQNGRLPPETDQIPLIATAISKSERRQNLRRMNRNLPRRDRCIVNSRCTKRFAPRKGCH